MFQSSLKLNYIILSLYQKPKGFILSYLHLSFKVYDKNEEHCRLSHVYQCEKSPFNKQKNKKGNFQLTFVLFCFVHKLLQFSLCFHFGRPLPFSYKLLFLFLNLSNSCIQFLVVKTFKIIFSVILAWYPVVITANTMNTA